MTASATRVPACMRGILSRPFRRTHNPGLVRICRSTFTIFRSIHARTNDPRQNGVAWSLLTDRVQPMSAWFSWFRLFGVLVLSVIALGAWLLYVHFDPSPDGPWETSWRVSWNVLSVSMGVGLLGHRKWAAVLFAALMAGFGAWELVEALPYVPSESITGFLGLTSALSLFPGYITFSYWKTLR